MPDCAQCEKDVNTAKLCSGCKEVYYCGKECQRKHWGTHKSQCQRTYRAVGIDILDGLGTQSATHVRIDSKDLIWREGSLSPISVKVGFPVLGLSVKQGDSRIRVATRRVDAATNAKQDAMTYSILAEMMARPQDSKSLKGWRKTTKAYFVRRDRQDLNVAQFECLWTYICNVINPGPGAPPPSISSDDFRDFCEWVKSSNLQLGVGVIGLAKYTEFTNLSLPFS
ncbi:hypothetical protein PENSPDRAFT_691418 [Peniophora sp. CONT]|nr:hypothetical protein PENSPDRAFT_691418 [Peniophora sp. CONT]